MSKTFFTSLFFILIAISSIGEGVSIDLPLLEPPKLSLSAQATIRKPADELQMKVGVITLGTHAEATLSENSTKMQAVIHSLEEAGLSRTEYQTGHFSINPTYTPYPHNPPPEWKQTINGYEVSNSIIIRTDKIDMAGKLIDAANKAGANSFTDINFGLHDSRLHWKEALTAATQNAMSDAQVIAATAGVQLAKVLSISLNSTNVNPHHVNAKYLAQAMDSSGGTAPLEPGEVTITAHISIVYEIAN